MSTQIDKVDTLEEAANSYADKHGFRVPYDSSNKFYDDNDVKWSKEGFKAGAEWQKTQQSSISEEIITDLEDFFFEIRPHINGHISAMNKFYKAIDSIKAAQSKKYSIEDIGLAFDAGYDYRQYLSDKIFGARLEPNKEQYINSLK